MVLSPKDVESYQDKLDEKEITRAVEDIDKYLATNWDRRSVTISCQTFGPNLRVQEKVAQMYRKAGWKLERKGDQRDGDFYFMTSGLRS